MEGKGVIKQMSKKIEIINIILIDIFITIDIILTGAVFIHKISGKITIKNIPQRCKIINQIAREYEIEDKIKEITYKRGFRRGYTLKIYTNNDVKEVSERHVGLDYFENLKKDDFIQIEDLAILCIIEGAIVIVMKKLEKGGGTNLN